jgi:hypothetical protein
MNTIKNLIARIEEYRATNANPCKNYATEQSAEKAATKMAKAIAVYYSDDENTTESPSYVVFYNPAWGRWCVAFNIVKLLNKYGGYMGYASNKGFFTYSE